MSKKKKIIIAAIIIIVLIIVAVALFIFLRPADGNSAEGQAYVSPVAEITGQGNAGMFNRYTGVVEPQETLDIEANSGKKIKEIFVSEGDAVSIDTPLFSYDTDEINLQLSQAQLDLEGYANEISSLYSQIAALEKERSTASADDKLEYTTQIQEKQNAVRRAEYNQKSKQVEIEQIRKSLDNAIVTSSISGIVQSINQNGEYDNMTGQPLPFMTILATANFRIQGKINETNIAAINEGSSVIIRSRVDENQIWTGTISGIDFENPLSNNNNYIYDGSGGEQSSNYPFYIELDTSSGLMLGQHVYIELDNGQMVEKDGLWLMENYIVLDDGDPYVWAMNNRNRLEKCKVKLGDYDSQMMEYEVVSGLTEEDYIAWPTSILEEGMPCAVSSVAEMMQRNMEAEMMQQMESGMDGGMNMESFDGNIDDIENFEGDMNDLTGDGEIIDSEDDPSATINSVPIR